jgi:hypothetical protein
VSSFRPLTGRRDTKVQADKWRRAVFATYGKVCVFHLRDDAKSKMPATDPAHIVDRARLGSIFAYGPKPGTLAFERIGGIDARLGRPLCRLHHDRQGSKANVIADRFSYVDVLSVVNLYNTEYEPHKKLPNPNPEDYPT